MLDSILSEFDAEWSSTKRMLERIPEEQLSWKPHPKSMSIGQLGIHIAGLPAGLLPLIRQEEFDLAGVNFDPPQPQSKAEILAGWEASKQSAAVELAGFTPEQAAGTWRLKNGSRTIAEIPRIAAVRNLILSHLYHHRGQLSVYLRLLDVPVPATFGPSKDENPFGG